MHDHRGDGRGRAELQDRRLTSRPASRADVLAFYGYLPSETLKLMAIVLGDEVVGVIGLARTLHSTRLFSEHKPELVPYLSRVTVWRAVKAVLRWVDECACVVYVVSDDRKMMERLGFREVTQGLWQS